MKKHCYSVTRRTQPKTRRICAYSGESAPPVGEKRRWSLLLKRLPVLVKADGVFSQDRYDEAVKLCIERFAQQLGGEIPMTKKVELTTIKWSHDKTKRCGRTAFQLSKKWAGKYRLEKA